jgi:hypothetical protein
VSKCPTGWFLNASYFSVVSLLAEKRSAYRVLAENLELKKPLGRWKDNIKMNLTGIR